jgi:hypothetical protein
MPRLEVHIGEMSRSIEAPFDPTKPVPEIRDVWCVVDAPDQQAATELAWSEWDAKHGPDQRPNGSVIKITEIGS